MLSLVLEEARQIADGRGRQAVGQIPPRACEVLEDRRNPAAVSTHIIATSVEAGTAPIVSVFDAATSKLKFTVDAFEGTFFGGVRVAVGDVNGDGTEDLIAGTGRSGGTRVQVFSGVDGHLLQNFFSGDDDNRGGASVAAADFNHDGHADIVIGSIKNSVESIQILSGADGSLLHEFRPFDASIQNVNVAAADYNGDGTPDAVVGPASMAAPGSRSSTARTAALSSTCSPSIRISAAACRLAPAIWTATVRQKS